MTKTGAPEGSEKARAAGLTVLPGGFTENLIDEVAVEPPVFDPVGWADRHGIFLWSKQREYLQSFVDNRYTVITACHGIGKSFAMAVLMVCWIDTYGYDAFVCFTSSSHKQVEGILNRELRNVVRLCKLSDTIDVNLDCEIKYKGELRGYGRKPSDTNEEGFSGIHGLYPLMLLDEGCKIPKILFESAETIAVNENARVGAAGNPDNPITHFREINQDETWNVINVPAHDTPAWTGEQIPELLTAHLISKVWVEERKKRWGVNSNRYKSKVLAQFPEASENAVYDLELIDESMTTETNDLTKPKCLCVDVASSGTDEAVAYAIRGDGDVTLEMQHDTCDITEFAEEIFEWWQRHKYAIVVVDANGIGEGVWSLLKKWGCRVKAFVGQGKPRNPTIYLNARAESHMDTARAMRDGLVRFDRYDSDLRDQLPTIIKERGPKDKWKLMSKEDMAEQGYPSPDRADAIAMGCWILKLGMVRSGKKKGFASDGVVTAGSTSYAA